MSLYTLRALREATKALAADQEVRPLKYARWTVAQRTFLTAAKKYKLIRCGNGVGKTWVCVADCIWRAEGYHPFRPIRAAPTHQLVTCISWSQAIPIMKTFHELLDYTQVKRCREFRPKDGFGKDGPVIEFRNGSTIRFGTMDQGARRHAGAKYDHVLIDEPPGPDHYRELERRVFRTAGDLTIGLTPINAPGPLDWLQDLTARGVIQDMHFRLTMDVTTFTDGSVRRLKDGTKMDEAWIAQQRHEAMAMFAPVILDGEWNLAAVGAFFDRFNTADHVTDHAPQGKWDPMFGVDYGAGRNKSQFGLLVLYRKHPLTGFPQVYVMDEDATEGDTIPQQDARRYLEMLERHGLHWANLVQAHGDKPYQGKKGGVNAKSNDELTYALASLLRIQPAELTPELEQVKRGRGGGRGSIEWTARWLHRCMLRPGHFQVHSRCTQLIEALQRWDWADNEYKHPIDALRYGVWTPAMAGRPSGGTHSYIYTG